MVLSLTQLPTTRALFEGRTVEQSGVNQNPDTATLKPNEKNMVLNVDNLFSFSSPVVPLIATMISPIEMPHTLGMAVAICVNLLTWESSIKCLWRPWHVKVYLYCSKMGLKQHKFLASPGMERRFPLKTSEYQLNVVPLSNHPSWKPQIRFSALICTL